MARGSDQLSFPRAAGILLPVFSLPGRYGIGSLGQEALRFVDFLAAAGQRYWQILPMGPTSYGDSPYQSFSTFAGNPYFIDIDALTREGLIAEAEAEQAVVPGGAAIDYERLFQTRHALLRKAYEAFLEGEGTARRKTVSREGFETFCGENASWLADYALFMALKAAHGYKSFLEWERPLRRREERTIAAAREKYADDIRFHSFVQYLFFTQYRALKRYAQNKGIRIIGDVPIYVAPDSADVWANPALFQLDEDCIPTAVAGCPPDAFSATGQLWGNPLYRWEKHKETDFAWWMERLRHAFSLCDVLRIDHFRGFEAYYSIPWGSRTAEHGHWEKGPDHAFFETLRDRLGDVPVIAEDLGFLTPEVLELVADTGYPGMKVLQFAFDSGEDNSYLPHHYGRKCVVYTGTHDNDTTNGWYAELPRSVRDFAADYLGLADPEDVAPAFIRAALGSVADTAIIPMQDWLSLGSAARINHPSTLGGNWGWRMREGALTTELAARIGRMTRIYSRFQ